ncbi:flagellar biosynthesis protein FlhA [Bacillus multifaciens]|uniref:flagellar biosynthesis protein FlhA n=1 Tax=Bacillus multifaciens TaxID=3068506 RepID=UPI0027418B6D|nr:flagellar biosynthesis protein FlhA [Bacillus sp. WLY-B-L8]MDP7981145.1 flagellar biosynthesis protein FlhA [Bacillus sp. WLY-B-L8]HDX9590812.1 flagellar biosynthesis protein FlhA [Bacillus pseudomycoides]
MFKIDSAKTYFSIFLAVSFIVALLIPLPPFILDVIIVFLLGMAVLVYMRATSIKEWDELKSFPTLLLLIGIFRVSINVSTTRAILTNGNAGHVIEEFGQFVIGGNLLIGIVIFIVLIIFQFIVANGSSRTAEVAARFTLDSLPGKQMSIDADLNQRIITDTEAKDKRKKLNMETEFYGAMDGAGKFVKGDVIFSIVILFVNIIFGLIVGMMQQGMGFQEAAYHFTKLTIGDGIVNQIGSLLLAISTGIIVTRVFDGSDDTVNEGIYKELMAHDVVVYALGGLFIAMGVFSPLPLIPFLIVGGGIIFLGYTNKQRLKKEKEEELQKELEMIQSDEDQMKKVEDSFGVFTDKYPIIVELGLDLAALVKQKINGETARDKVVLMRKSIITDLGINVPGINFKDNTSFRPRGRYVIRIKGAKVAEGVLKSGYLLALKTPNVMADLDAEPAKDPIFGEDGYWILEHVVQDAQMKGYQVLEPLSILITHLDVVIRRNVHELLQRQHVKDLIQSLENDHGVLLEEIKKKEIDLSLIQNVVKQLLKEGISIRDLPTIMEGIIDGKEIYQNQADGVTAFVRECISKVICEHAKNYDGKIYAALFSDAIELDADVVNNSYQGYLLNWDLEQETRVIDQIQNIFKQSRLMGRDPVLLTRRKDFRFGIVRLLDRYQIEAKVLCISELAPEITVDQIAYIE